MYIKTKIITEGSHSEVIEKTHPDFENMTAVFIDAKSEEGKFFSQPIVQPRSR